MKMSNMSEVVMCPRCWDSTITSMKPVDSWILCVKCYKEEVKRLWVKVC